MACAKLAGVGTTASHSMNCCLVFLRLRKFGTPSLGLASVIMLTLEDLSDRSNACSLLQVSLGM